MYVRQGKYLWNFLMAFVMKAGVSHALNVVSKRIKTFRIQVTPSKSSGKKDKTRGQICLPPHTGS